MPTTSTSLAQRLSTFISMPAKIRTIRGFKNPDGLIDFNKSINPRGGTEGKLVFAEGNRSTKIKLYQDKNEDGKFSKKELLYKGRLDDVEYDAILNVNKVKLQKQMHSCDWQLMKNPDKLIVCTLDFVPTVYDLTLIAESGETWMPGPWTPPQFEV